MKKIASFLFILFMGILTGCSSLPKETFTYKTEDDLSVSILKTKVYEDKLVVKFSQDAFSSVESIRCYDENFEEILKEVTFKGEDNVITIYTEEADQISGLKVTVNDMLYYQIRYLDSDSYAMLQGDWAYDYGYFVSGDEDAFYTEAEKEKQKRLQEERLAEQARAYAMLEGQWDSEDGLTRIVFADSDELSMEIYKYSEGNWELSQSINCYSISLDEEAEPVCISMEEARGYSMLYSFWFNEDKTEFTCSCAEGNFCKVSSEEAE
ncbi:MAG: hypothetical protein IJ429_03810 [Lachnospiraceae bacterium]|nr:hypothetical protein [Lachnospiraceae bacterium]